MHIMAPTDDANDRNDERKKRNWILKNAHNPEQEELQ